MTTAKVQIDGLGMRTKVAERVFQAWSRKGKAVELLLQSGHKVVSRKGDDDWAVVSRMMFPGKRVEFDPVTGRIQPVVDKGLAADKDLAAARVSASMPIPMPKRGIQLRNRIEGMNRWEFDEFSRSESDFAARDAMEREIALMGRDDRRRARNSKRTDRTRSKARRLQRALRFAELF